MIAPEIQTELVRIWDRFGELVTLIKEDHRMSSRATTDIEVLTSQMQQRIKAERAQRKELTALRKELTELTERTEPQGTTFHSTVDLDDPAPFKNTLAFRLLTEAMANRMTRNRRDQQSATQPLNLLHNDIGVQLYTLGAEVERLRTEGTADYQGIYGIAIALGALALQLGLETENRRAPRKPKKQQQQEQRSTQ